MKYILRVVIHENRWERQLSDVIKICKYAGIEEILAKEQCHQILMSPTALDKDRRMKEIYKQFADKLRENGIRFSVNIATIVGHCDADLEEKDCLPYTHFVGEDMRESHTNYCILDEGWQKFACEKTALYAESKPDILMIDDDFRSLNHSCDIGCFCPLHVKAVSERAGVPLTKEELLKHVRGNSKESRRIREIWMQVNYEGQRRAAKKIGEAVRAVSPDTRVGLMNSGEPNHSIQGRDIDELIKTFAGDKKPVSRPSGGIYGDDTHENLIAAIQGMSLSMSQLKDVEIISEVENWPHTRYTKSLHMTALQMKLHTLSGADAITMNVFDFMGTPYERDMRLCNLLKETKPELDLIHDLRQGKTSHGVGLLWHRKAALNKKQGLRPDRSADTLLPMLGIPTSFKEGDVNFLPGDVCRSLDDETIERLLKKGLILDTDATLNLYERGFSHLIGCEIDGEISAVSAEKTLDSEFAGQFKGDLLPTDLLRQHLKGDNIPKIKPLKGARVLTEIIDRDYQKIGDGITIFENEVGGRVCVIPTKLITWTFAYRARAYMLREIVSWMDRNNTIPKISEGVNVAPFYFTDENGDGLLALLNSGLDEEPLDISINADVESIDGEKVDLKNITLPPLSLTYYKTKTR